MQPTLVVTFALKADERAILAETVGDAGQVLGLGGLDQAERTAALRTARAVLTRNPFRELASEEIALLASAALVQFMPAGIDFVPIGDLPPGVTVASNSGAYSAPMAEHAAAMVLAAAKRLLPEHAALARGAFNQQAPNRMLAGMVCGILGFGGIGRATARLMRAFGMRIHAVNRSGAASEAADWIGPPERLDEFLAACDVLVISTPLTRSTVGLIGARELGLMKPDAILVNLARGEIIDEAALFAHLQANPRFTACIDAWWVEPVRHGAFRMDHPFTTLPNVIGSPHNSASVPQTKAAALRSAAANCRRALRGEKVANIVRTEDRYL